MAPATFLQRARWVRPVRVEVSLSVHRGFVPANTDTGVSYREAHRLSAKDIRCPHGEAPLRFGV